MIWSPPQRPDLEAIERRLNRQSVTGWYGYQQDGLALLAEVRALRTALRPRQEFFEKCWDAARDAQEIGGDDVQEWGEQLGLLKAVRVTEPCGDGCWCAEYVGNDFPADCLRLVPLPDGVGAPERDLNPTKIESGGTPQS